MRVNVYAEEMTNIVEVFTKDIDGREYAAIRFWLHLPVTIPERFVKTGQDSTGSVEGYTEPSRNVRGPFMHRPGDDDSSAVTFWGKKDLRKVLELALEKLTEIGY